MIFSSVCQNSGKASTFTEADPHNQNYTANLSQKIVRARFQMFCVEF
jgi:hypothetical protein